jgi:amidase
MKVDEYSEYDATGLAQLIRSRQVTAAEVQQAAREAILRVDDRLNAVVGEPFEQPLAYREDGPFAGVPFVVKDLLCHAAGVPQRAGTRMTGDGVRFDYDTFLMDRFRAAGLATLAITTTPELGFNATTEALTYGSTHNPWDLSRSPGGSSGGTAALVAAGAIPVGHGNDGGGSIRIPASCCGLVGLKPTRGRTSLGPDYSEAVSGFGIEFALTRTLRDCAALLDAVAGSMPGDRYVIREPERPWSQELGASAGRLRIAFTTRAWSGVPVDSECEAAVQKAARELQSLGHEVEEASPSFDAEAFHLANVRIWCEFLAEGISALSSVLSVQPSRENLEATTFACYEYGRQLTALQWAEAGAIVNQVSRNVGAFFSRYDLLLTPTIATPPYPLGVLNADDPSLDADGWTRKIFTLCPFTGLFNATGQPALSLPLSMSSDGLPIGVQLVGRMCE